MIIMIDIIMMIRKGWSAVDRLRYDDDDDDADFDDDVDDDDKYYFFDQ